MTNPPRLKLLRTKKMKCKCDFYSWFIKSILFDNFNTTRTIHGNQLINNQSIKSINQSINQINFLQDYDILSRQIDYINKSVVDFGDKDFLFPIKQFYKFLDFVRFNGNAFNNTTVGLVNRHLINIVNIFFKPF